MAVRTDTPSLSSCLAPNCCPQMMAQPVPMPTENPTTRSTRLCVACMPPSAVVEANLPMT